MMKKIAVVNDLSGFGRCSLTAAISRAVSHGSAGMSASYGGIKRTDGI